MLHNGVLYVYTITYVAGLYSALAGFSEDTRSRSTEQEGTRELVVLRIHKVNFISGEVLLKRVNLVNSRVALVVISVT